MALYWKKIIRCAVIASTCRIFNSVVTLVFCFCSFSSYAVDTVKISIAYSQHLNQADTYLNNQGIEYDSVLCIPILCLKKGGHMDTCTQRFIDLIDFEVRGYQNILYKEGSNLVITEIGEPGPSYPPFYISYGNQKVEASIYWVLSDAEKQQFKEGIFRYKNDNNAFVFLLIGFDGFWSIEHNQLYKLHLKKRGRVRKEFYYDFLYRFYYNKYKVNDLIKGELLTGHYGLPCPEFSKKKSEWIELSLD